MTTLIAPILFAAVIVFVAYPFLVETPERASKERRQTALQKALKRKEDIIATIKDIEMDYRMGKLSDDDYQSLKNEQEFKAISVLQEIEKLEKKSKSRRKKS